MLTAPPIDDQRRALEVAIAAAREAGAMLRAEFHREGGARGERGKSPADVAAEALLRARLCAAFPDDGFRAEEVPAANRPPSGVSRCTWLVDPNDGTSAFLRGHRGASVSIARVRDGEPVLGVIFAYTAVDDAGDLISWAEGCGSVHRDGRPIGHPGWPEQLSGEHVVLVSNSADRRARHNARLTAPARYRPVPGIAYRLALVAAGEGVAAISLFGSRDFDYAAGHALLRGVGGDLCDERGRAIRYHPELPRSVGFVFGGAPHLLPGLAARDWGSVLRARDDPPEPGSPVRPQVGALIEGGGQLARAQGCWLGQLVGDALGSQVEFKSPEAIAAAWPDGVHALRDGGTFDTLAGQPTDDSELALALARSLVERGGYDADAVARAYGGWLASQPFDIGNTTRRALMAVAGADHPADAAKAAADPQSQANGALMRISPLAIAGVRWAPERLAAAARADAALTHPHPICIDANAVFALTLAFAIREEAGPVAVWEYALACAEAVDAHPDVRASLLAARDGPPEDFLTHQGWVRIALRNAFYQLREAPSLRAGLMDTVGRGGDTDTNACIAGALLGAVHGRDAVPLAWRDPVLTCRPILGLPGVRRPRPRSCWPVDALVLPERLLALGR